MKITLVSHASVLIEANGVKILTDPWFVGKAFNESWSLLPPAANGDLSGVDYLWISHEHPDHFHIETLTSLPAEFKSRVTVLFQLNNSDKLPLKLNQLGFKKIVRLPHRKIAALSDGVSVYCYQSGLMDACLGVLADKEEILLNINDAPFNAIDAKIALGDLKRVDVILNQFSYATYNGLPDFEKNLPLDAKQVLDEVAQNHTDLKAKVTIPFASFIYFSSEENKYMNAFANTPESFHRFFKEKGLQSAILYPGETYQSGLAHDNAATLKKFEEIYNKKSELVFDKPKTVELNLIFKAFDKLIHQLYEKYPRFLLRRLKPVSVHIPDLNKSVAFSIRSKSIAEIEGSACDLTIGSQAFYFTLAHPWGGQTLTISGRLRAAGKNRNWLWHRLLFAFNNAEIYLKPKYLFERRMRAWVWSRRKGVFSQFVSQLVWLLKNNAK